MLATCSITRLKLNLFHSWVWKSRRVPSLSPFLSLSLIRLRPPSILIVLFLLGWWYMVKSSIFSVKKKKHAHTIEFVPARIGMPYPTRHSPLPLVGAYLTHFKKLNSNRLAVTAVWLGTTVWLDATVWLGWATLVTNREKEEKKKLFPTCRPRCS